MARVRLSKRQIVIRIVRQADVVHLSNSLLLLECYDAMNDDLATPQVISNLFEACTVVNKLTDHKATSDKIRDELAAAGFEVKDTMDGVTWKLNK
jgi:cysteinyl-tRNA synthetase